MWTLLGILRIDLSIHIFLTSKVANGILSATVMLAEMEVLPHFCEGMPFVCR